MKLWRWYIVWISLQKIGWWRESKGSEIFSWKENNFLLKKFFNFVMIDLMYTSFFILICHKIFTFIFIFSCLQIQKNIKKNYLKNESPIVSSIRNNLHLLLSRFDKIRQRLNNFILCILHRLSQQCLIP